jgi:hypothetical protein
MALAWVEVLIVMTSQGPAANPPAEPPAGKGGIDLHVVLETRLAGPVGQMRAVPVRLGREPAARAAGPATTPAATSPAAGSAAPATRGRLPAGKRGVLAVFGRDAEVDPYIEMFFFPTGPLKLAMLDPAGGVRVLWTRDLGRGVVPGIWFCPVYPFDLDGDGAEEIWLVGSADDDHPLSLNAARLERLDPATGKTTGQWPWPATDGEQSPSHLYRRFIVGGYVRGKPVLVTAQGTYGPMKLQGWNPDMSLRWEHAIAAKDPGARGSHMCPVVDINGDGVDELMWGERCIELDKGRELFCADRDTWAGHSDIVQPVLDRSGGGKWTLFTCRESGTGNPRVAAYDQAGRRIWGDLDAGHMDMGWVARLGDAGEPVAMAIRIGAKSAGPAGFARKGVEEFTYDAATGKGRPLGFSVFATVPVDLDGDGLHELVRGLTGGDGAVLDRKGRVLGQVAGSVAAVGKLLDHPGEQVLTWQKDGTIRIYAARNAADTAAAKQRFAHPYYSAAQRLTATGYNYVNLGGL